jgi:hypothetical protein
MKNIDEIIKNSKPEVPILPEDFGQNIILKIKEQNLKIKPPVTLQPGSQWISLISGILLMLIALIFANNTIFEVQMNGSLELLSFGTKYATDFTNYLPLDMISITLLILGGSTWLLWKSHMLKQGIALIAAGSFLVSSIGGSALAATRVNERIQSEVIKQENTIPIISWFYKERARFHMDHPNVLMGKVIEQKDNSITIQDPRGKTVKIILPGGTRVQNGQYLRLDGKQVKDEFLANVMQHCNPTTASRYFSHMGMGPHKMNKKMMKHHQMMHGEDNKEQ